MILARDHDDDLASRTFDSPDAFLHWLTERLVGEIDPLRIVDIAIRALERFLGVARIGYGEVDLAQGCVTVPREWTRPGAPAMTGRHPFAPADDVARRLQQGGTIAIGDLAEAPASEQARALFTAAGVRACLAAPLRRDERLIALLIACDERPRHWQPAEIQLLAQTVTRIWGAIEHLRLTEKLRESETQFRLLAEHIPGLCWIWDGTSVRWANSQWHALFDGTEGGRGDPSALVHPDDMPLAAAAWKAMRAGEESAEIQLRIRGKDGIYRPYLSKAVAVRDAGGAVAHWCGVQIDLTEKHALDRRQALVRALHDRTRDLTDPDAVLAVLGETLTSHFGISHFGYCEAQGGRSDRLELHLSVHGERQVPGPAAARIAEAFRQMAAGSGWTQSAVVEDGSGIDPAKDPPGLVALARLGVVSGIVMPIRRDGRLTAAVAALHERPRRWTQDDVYLCEDLAEHAWSTLSRIRAEAELRERERNQALLIAWSDRTRSETSPERIIDDTLHCLGEELGARRVTYAESDAAGRVFTVRAEWRGAGVPSNLGNSITLGTYGESADREWLGGDLVVYDDVEQDPRVTPAALERYRTTRIGAFISAPLVREGVARSVISVQDNRPRRWRQGEMQLLRDIAERAWVTIERARAQADLQARDRNQQFLIGWSDRMRLESSPKRIIALTLESLAAQLDVTRVTHAETDPAGQHFTVRGEWRAPHVRSLLGSDFLIDSVGREVTHAWMRGELVRYDDVARDPGLQPDARERYQAADIRAFISVPLVKDGLTRSALSIQHDRPRQWRDSEIQLIRDVAERTWATLERARSEERLAESEAQLSAFLENAPLVMHIQDADGRYLRINPEFARAVGRPVQTICGAHPAEIFPVAAAKQLMALELRARSGQVASAELELGLGDRYTAALAILFPIHGPAGSSRTAGFTIDLTERKRAEAALARSREALYQSEKLSALGSLLAGVSHELNNPLSIVVAQAVMMERQARGTELAERAQKICKAADRCARIVQTFLAMARQKKPERAAVNLNDIARAAHELTDYGLRSDNIVTRWELAEQLPCISADSDQLHQVLINLIVNAQQAMAQVAPDCRTLTIRTAAGAEGTVLLEVTDTGPGIPEEMRRRIFEPFFTTKPQGQGTGMGLSFSQGLIEAHGGRLEMVRSIGGACFRITLPIDEDGVVPAPAPAAGAASATPRRALVVDDEPEIAESLADFLSLEGFACDVAVGGTIAQQMLAVTDYDLIVSDLRMPDMDGPQLHGWIAAERPELLDRMGFSTGDTLGSAAERFLGAVRRPVLEKPFVPDAVHRFLQEMDLA